MENENVIIDGEVSEVTDELNNNVATIEDDLINVNEENNEDEKLDKEKDEELDREKIEEIDTIKNSVKQLRELAERYEESARETEEAGTYCTLDDLSIAGIGMENKINDCSDNFRDMAMKLNAYADELEASLNNIEKGD